MPSRGKEYGNASQVTTHVDSYADGGKVEVPKPKKNPLPPPQSGGKPKRIGEGMGSPGGPHTPGAKGTYPPRNKKKKK